MFHNLRRNFGNVGFVLPLTALMGALFHADVWETLYAAALFYITSLILLMIDDVISFRTATK